MSLQELLGEYNDGRIFEAVSRLSPAVRELLVRDPDKLDADVRLLMPMTPEEAKALDAAGPVSLSNKRVEEILANIMRRDRRLRLLIAAERLSNATQDLLIANPEAVEAAVELAIAHKAMIATPCNEPNVMDIALLTKACVEAEINSIAALSPKMEGET